MNRQCRRRIERQWNKIRLSNVCTNFIERNGLFKLPYVFAFQAVKVSNNLMCVYYVGLFDFKKGSGYREGVVVCQFVGSLFRSLGSLPLGFVPEENLENGEEIEG